MKWHVDSTAFGHITIDGRTYNHNVVIVPTGEILNRQDALPNPAGSHRVTEADAQRLLKLGGECLIIGTGQSGLLRLDPEARAAFEQQDYAITLARTPEAADLFNATASPVLVLFHLTC